MLILLLVHKLITNYQLIKNFVEKRERQVDTNLNVDEKFDALQFLNNKESKVSSFITIQEGCDKF